MTISGNVPDSGALVAGVTPASGVPSNDQLQVRANPNEFGAQVGQAVEKGGQIGEQVATQWAGIKAETEANQNELNYTKAQGDLKAKYSQYEGLQADAMRPQYEAESMALQAKYKEGLSPIAGRMFDSATRRSLGNDISQYAGYAAGQVKKANLDSFKAIGDLQVAKTGDPSYVMDDDKFMAGIGTLRHANNSIADHMGLGFEATGKDEDTGMYTFPDTPSGNDAKARYQQLQDADLSRYYMGAVKTLAATNPKAASDFVESHQKYMPDLAKAEAQQYLAPKMINQNIDNAIGYQNGQVAGGWQQNILSGGKQPDLLETINKNEGFTGKIGKDSNGANVINGINEKAFPDEYKSVAAAYGKSKADGDAATNQFFQKEIIDKYDIKSLPPATQAIVADGLVNHGAGDFGQSLIAAAKNGASPQQLIDMRRQEYQRLSDADTDGSKGYKASLTGWNSRLDGLQKQSQGQPQYANQKDYLESIKSDGSYVQGAVDAVARQYPDNLAIQQTVQKRAELNLNAQIAKADAALKSDRDNIQNAISGGMTKGQVPMTPQELSAIPNIQPVLDRVAREQGDFYKSIETRMAKATHGDTSQNSPNAYDAALTVLDTSDKKYPRQEQIEYLSKGLGSENPGFSISQKDFNDFKPAIDLDDSVKSKVYDGMKSIASANGNLDGKGQQRAVQWYQSVMSAYKNKAESQTVDDFANNIKPPAELMPSRAQQLRDIAQKPPQEFTDKAQYDTAQSGTVYIRNGQQYRKP